VMVFGYEWSRTKSFAAVLRTWPLTPPFVAVLLTGTSAAGLLAYGKGVLVYKVAIWLRAMRDQSFELDVTTLLAILLAILAALLRRRIDGRLGWAALLLGILTLALPRHFGGGDYADYRLIAAALLLGCLAIDWRAPRWALWLAPALFLVRLGVTASAWHAQSQEVAAMMPALDKLPRGARVAGAVALDVDAWALESHGHLPSYATVRRDALVNTHFAIPGVHMLQLKQGGPGFADPSQRIFYRKGDPIDLAAFAPARQADYLWYIGKPTPARMPPGATVLYRSEGSFLARLANPQIPR